MSHKQNDIYNEYKEECKTMNTQVKHTPTPWKYFRSWEGCFEPDEDSLTEYLKEPYTRIEGVNGEIVVTPHDLFTFRPGDAQFIVKAVNAHDELVKVLKQALLLCGDRTANVPLIKFNIEQALKKVGE